MHLQITQLLNPSIILIRLQNFMEFFKNFNTNFNAKSIRWLEFISLLTKIIKELYSCLTWWVALKVCLIFLAFLQWMYPMQKLLKVYELFLWNHHFFWFGQQQEFIRIVLLKWFLKFFNVVHSCVFDLSSEYLKLI